MGLKRQSKQVVVESALDQMEVSFLVRVSEGRLNGPPVLKITTCLLVLSETLEWLLDVVSEW